MDIERKALQLFAMGLIRDSEEQRMCVDGIESNPGLMFELVEFFEDPANPPDAVLEAFGRYSTDDRGVSSQIDWGAILASPAVERKVGKATTLPPTKWHKAVDVNASQIAAGTSDTWQQSSVVKEVSKDGNFIDFTVDIQQFESRSDTDDPTIIWMRIGKETRKVKGEAKSVNEAREVKGRVCCNYFGLEKFTEKTRVEVSSTEPMEDRDA